MTRQEVIAAVEKTKEQIGVLHNAMISLRKTLDEKVIDPFSDETLKEAKELCKSLNASQKKGKGKVWKVYSPNSEYVSTRFANDGYLSYEIWNSRKPTTAHYVAHDGVKTKTFYDVNDAKRYASTYQKNLEVQNKVDVNKVLQEQIIALRKDLARAITGKRGK